MFSLIDSLAVCEDLPFDSSCAQCLSCWGASFWCDGKHTFSAFGSNPNGEPDTMTELYNLQ